MHPPPPDADAGPETLGSTVRSQSQRKALTPWPCLSLWGAASSKASLIFQRVSCQELGCALRFFSFCNNNMAYRTLPDLGELWRPTFLFFPPPALLSCNDI